MNIKRVDFLSPIVEPASHRRSTSSVTAGDGLSIAIGGGMVTLSREGCDTTLVPLTNVKCIIVEPSAPQAESKKGK